MPPLYGRHLNPIAAPPLIFQIKNMKFSKSAMWGNEMTCPIVAEAIYQAGSHTLYSWSHHQTSPARDRLDTALRSHKEKLRQFSSFFPD